MQDYSFFVNAAYLSSGFLLGTTAIFAILKLRRSQKKLALLEQKNNQKNLHKNASQKAE